MPDQQDIRHGVLMEVSPFGTGFIMDKATEAWYGFHISMLGSISIEHAPTGTEITFRLDRSGAICDVKIK